MSELLGLPIDAFLPGVVRAVQAGRDVVLVAEPGAGKTTRIAPALVRSGLSGKLTMLQPRRIAARAAAARIAKEQHWTLGHEVGYQVRFDKKMTADTPLRIVTEGVLTRQLAGDPSLDGVACVVLDEFHERSLDGDLALAMLREAKLALRDDLRVVVMSATLDAEQVATFLRESGEVELFNVPGRLFPVDIEHVGPTAPPIEPHAIDATRREIDRGLDGDVLIFLPGAGEIERVMGSLAGDAQRAGIDLLPLHGGLTSEQQDEAVRTSDRPRIICATNIAETSLTLPNVRVVIDSGLERRAEFDASRGMTTLTTRRISQASAAQRAGRAGRVAAGRCVRLWSKIQHGALEPFAPAEIERVDLSPAVLSVMSWGGDPTSFGWFQSPPPRHLSRATDLLDSLGGTKDNRLTDVGRRLQTLPVDPRAGRLLLAASEGLRDEAATIAALLGEDLRESRGRGTSLDALLSRYRGGKLSRRESQAVRRASEALLRASRSLPPGPARTIDDALLLAFADRVCKRRSPDTATMVAKRGEPGIGVKLPDPSAARGEWFLALDLSRPAHDRSKSAVAHVASDLDLDRLRALLPEKIEVASVCEYDAESGKLRGKRRTMYENLVLDERDTGQLDPAAATDALRAALLPEAERHCEELRPTLARFALARVVLAEQEWPNVSPQSIVSMACEGARSRQDVMGNLAVSMQTLLGYDAQRRLDELLPTHLTSEAGSRIELRYEMPTTDAPRPSPVMAVRLQEMFGAASTPNVAGGRVAVKLELLGPNYRPVAVTEDLASFWLNVYPQVRKDLRARYAKHSWPEDPAAAVAMRGTKKQHERRTQGN